MKRYLIRYTLETRVSDCAIIIIHLAWLVNTYFLKFYKFLQSIRSENGSRRSVAA